MTDFIIIIYVQTNRDGKKQAKVRRGRDETRPKLFKSRRDETDLNKSRCVTVGMRINNGDFPIFLGSWELLVASLFVVMMWSCPAATKGISTHVQFFCCLWTSVLA